MEDRLVRRIGHARVEPDLAQEDPPGSEVELEPDEPARAQVQLDGDVPGQLPFRLYYRAYTVRQLP